MAQVDKGIGRPETFAMRKLAYFPAAFLLFLAAAFCAPALEGRQVLVGIVVALVAFAVVLGVLASLSSLRVDPQGMEVRFFGSRSWAIKWEDVASVTFGMSFPSLAFGIWLVPRDMHRVRLNSGYWQDEQRLLSIIAPKLLEVSPKMDAETAQLLARLTHTKARPATLRLVPWLERRSRRRAAPPPPPDRSVPADEDEQIEEVVGQGLSQPSVLRRD